MDSVQITGYEGLYDITSCGNVINVRSGRVLSPSLYEGYQRVYLFKKGQRQMHKIHRLVAIHFISNPMGYETVNHINGIKIDNRVENLEWMTREQNTSHAHSIGLFDSSYQNAKSSRLIEREVIEIRRDTLNRYQDIADKYGVSLSTIKAIKTNRIWKKIK